MLVRQPERHARISKFNNGGNEADLNPNIASRNSGTRKPPEKNAFSEEQFEKLEFESGELRLAGISLGYPRNLTQ